MKNKLGISLVVLVIIIIVMIILSTVVIISGKNAYEDSQKSKMKIEIAQIENLANNYYTRKSGVLDFAKVELTIPDEYMNQFLGEDIVDSKVSMYVLDLNKIDASETSYGNLEQGENDRYIYSTTTKKVYYEKGIKIGGKIYYRIDNET